MINYSSQIFSYIFVMCWVSVNVLVLVVGLTWQVGVNRLNKVKPNHYIVAGFF